MRTKIILIVILVLAFIYWRGSKAVTKQLGLNCEYHLVYAMCKSKSVKLPTFLEVMSNGVKF